MRRGLHMKLVLIMLLLIISLMAVVGAFLIRGVMSFYLNEFYNQMESVFSRTEFVSNLRLAAADINGAEEIDKIVDAHSGLLGIDSGSRQYFILDGATGVVLMGSSDNTNLEITPNILTAMTGSEGYASNSTVDYMDVAMPIRGGDGFYIVYIIDSKQTVQDLNMELFLIIMEALVIGLVISILLSFMLSKTMVTPIESLTEAAQRVAAGDFTEKIDVQGRDEIGVLTLAFNNMARQLQDTLADIENERNKLSTLFLHMTDGVIAFTGDGGIMHENPAAETMLGENAGENYTEIFGQTADFSELLALQNPDFRSAEISRNGLELEVFFAPMSGEGVMAVIHDVTEKKKSDQLRREFVANVSHELRTPITSIRSYAETLAESDDIPLEMRHSFLGVIVNESDRMTKIVSDLLSLSKFDADSMEMKMEPFSFARAIGNVYDAMILEAKKQKLDMSIELQQNIPEITGDRTRIEQVIMNVVSNAVRYTPEGGSIEISAGSTDRTVWVSVADTGIGIPKEQTERVFDRFYRVDKARSRASGGTGLGLSIAKEIVERHSGSIQIKSASGQGTTVTVTLPRSVL